MRFLKSALPKIMMFLIIFWFGYQAGCTVTSYRHFKIILKLKNEIRKVTVMHREFVAQITPPGSPVAREWGDGPVGGER